MTIVTDQQREAAEAEIISQSRRIDFYLTEYSIEILANKVRDGDFVVPDYQREFTWEPERKSRFIESIIMGLPIPFLFFWEMADGKLEIVDGSQRLRTIEEFVLGDLCLGELESLPTISSFRFVDLAESRQRKIKNRSIRGIILNEHADAQARFDMFARINTSSKNANPAEIRRGALSGRFMDLVIELAGRDDFARVAPVSKKQKNEREREELVIRFFAYSDGLAGYRDRPSEFIFDYAKRTNVAFNESPTLVEEYRARFLAMVRFVESNFQNGFRRSARGTASPRARFEAISIGTYLALQARPDLATVPVDVTDWVNGKEFIDITGADGANAKARLRGRTEYVRDHLVAT